MNSAVLQDIRSTHKTLQCFYKPSNEQCRKEIMRIIPDMVASIEITYLGVNLTSDMEDFFTGH